MSVSTNTNCPRRVAPEMTTLELEEDGVRIALTIVDTPGFGDNIDNEFAYVVFKLHAQSQPLTLSLSFQEIVGHLERQYDDILAEESRIKRNPRFRDNRVHALLYFIPPTGHAYVSFPFTYSLLNPP
jgi:cell division control protein 11